MDRHSFRDLWVMFGAARKAHKRESEEAWRRTLWIIQGLINYGGPRDYQRWDPPPLNTLFESIFRDKPDMSNREIVSVLTGFSKARERRP